MLNTDELKAKHPHWPWPILLPHTPLSNTDYAYIAVESGRSVFRSRDFISYIIVDYPILLIFKTIFTDVAW